MQINVKMPLFTCQQTFMSRVNFVLSRVEYEKKIITSGPGFHDRDSLIKLYNRKCFYILTKFTCRTNLIQGFVVVSQNLHIGHILLLSFQGFAGVSQNLHVGHI